MHKSYAVTGMVMVCSILSACQRPHPALPLTPLANPVLTRTASPPKHPPVASFMPVSTFVPSTPPATPKSLVPLPDVTATVLPALTQPIRSCISRPGSAWRVWRVVQPDAVYALLADGDVLWAGTSFGVSRIDSRTSISIDGIDAEEMEVVYFLLPLGNGHIWASTSRGYFYYDGKQWSLVQLAGVAGGPVTWLSVVRTFCTKLAGVPTHRM